MHTGQSHGGSSRLLDSGTLRGIEFPEASDRTLLVGVSGGPDSVCLLRRLAGTADQHHLKLHAVHVNHGIRSGADHDEQFVQQLADDLGVAFSACKVQPANTSETALREARYDAFRKAAHKHGTTALALGHTRDDLAETVLMNLMRGTGLEGFRLSGYQLSDGLQIIRPLWRTSRAAIVEYLSANNWTHCIDETNDTLHPIRNRVRHLLLPLMEREFNPKIRESLARCANILGSAADYVQQAAARKLKKCARHLKRNDLLPTRWLAAQPEALKLELVRQWVHAQDLATFLSYLHVDNCVQLMISQRSDAVLLPGGSAIVCTGRIIWFYDASTAGPLQGTEDNQLRLATQHCRFFNFPLFASLEPVAVDNLVLTDLAGREVSLSISDPGGSTRFTIRNRQPGDRLPDGRPLKEIMINDKVPWYMRGYLGCIVDSHGAIVHVLGYDRLNGRVRAHCSDAPHIDWSYLHACGA